MSRALAALRSRLQGDRQAGISLVELLVTILITGIVMSIVAAMFVNVAKVAANANGTNTRTSVAGNVMNEMSKVIRTAANNAVSTSDDPDAAIVSGTVSTVTLYSYVDTSPTAPAPTKVTFRIDTNGFVWEDRIAATASGSYWVFTGATTSRNLGGPVSSDGFITYLDQDNFAVVPNQSNGTLGTTQRGTISSIKVTITIANNPTLGSDPVVLVNTIGMPNLLLTSKDT